MLKFNVFAILVLAILALAKASAPVIKQDSKGAAPIVNILAPKDVAANNTNDSTYTEKSEITFKNTASFSEDDDTIETSEESDDDD